MGVASPLPSLAALGGWGQNGSPAPSGLPTVTSGVQTEGQGPRVSGQLTGSLTPYRHPPGESEESWGSRQRRALSGALRLAALQVVRLHRAGRRWAARTSGSLGTQARLHTQARRLAESYTELLSALCAKHDAMTD